jgi:hypothetical protein
MHANYLLLQVQVQLLPEEQRPDFSAMLSAQQPQVPPTHLM